MKRALVFIIVAFVGALACSLPGADAAGWRQAEWQPDSAHKQIPIWPKTIPDANATKGPEEISVSDDLIVGKPITCVGKVTTPTMTVYPAKGKNTGAAVVVFPGGGYWILAMDLEGTEVCDWLTDKGVTCILLKYRVPGDKQLPRSGCYPSSRVALEDAQRAIRLVRSHAAEWQIDPHKIGVLGFSAGGHLVGATSTLFDKQLYKPVDEADKLSCRPDFAIALYPGHMTEHTSKDFQLNPYVPITKHTPPTFIVQAENDPVDDVQNSLVYFAGLKKAGVPAEMHIYADGKHAFGLRRTNLPITRWTDLAESWLKSIGII